MKVICLSDTHASERSVEIPDGDLLICSGDFSGYGTERDAAIFGNWLANLPHKHKVLVYGNHDVACAQKDLRFLFPGVHVLFDSEVTIEGLRIYGTPWQPKFCDWAFNLSHEDQQRMFSFIPNDLDILVTHCPPFGILDKNKFGERCGSKALAERLQQVKPRYHLFGHLHESGGKVFEHKWNDGKKTTFVNCSVLNDNYVIHAKPVVLEV